jgi:hypothetical protein
MTGTASAEPPPERRRRLARERTEAYRVRRRRGGVAVAVEVLPHHVRALERLALLGAGGRDRAAIGAAVGRFLEAAAHAAAMGDALWPEGEERTAGRDAHLQEHRPGGANAPGASPARASGATPA